MSTISLPKLSNGGFGGKKLLNWKFGSLSHFNTLPAKIPRKNRDTDSNKSIRSDNASVRLSVFEPPIPKPRMTRRGSLMSKNLFRGQKKDLLEKQASLYVHSMTVGYLVEKHLKKKSYQTKL